MLGKKLELKIYNPRSEEDKYPAEIFTLSLTTLVGDNKLQELANEFFSKIIHEAGVV